MQKKKILPNNKSYLLNFFNKPMLLKNNYFNVLETNLANVEVCYIDEIFEEQITKRSYIKQLDEDIAVIEVKGMMVEKEDFYSFYYGFCACETLVKDIRKCVTSGVSRIIFLVDSPGGEVDGVKNAADYVFSLRNKGIETIAIVKSLCCSGAQWFASACEKTGLISETAICGSVGVAYCHYDYSEVLKNWGIKATYIVAGKYKRIGAPEIPLDEEATSIISSQIEQIYKIFTSSIAKYRFLEISHVLDVIADGNIYIGEEAIKRKLADGYIDFEKVIGVTEVNKKFDIFKIEEEEKKDPEVMDEDPEVEEEENESEIEDDEDEEKPEVEDDEDEEKTEVEDDEEQENTEVMDDEKSVSLIQKGIKMERKRVLSLISLGINEKSLISSIKKGSRPEKVAMDIMKSQKKGKKHTSLMNEGTLISMDTSETKTKVKEKSREFDLAHVKAGASQFKPKVYKEQREIMK